MPTSSNTPIFFKVGVKSSVYIKFLGGEFMLFIFMGPSCSGKSSAAEELKKLTDVQIYSGKDYLRMDKNENNAWQLFEEILKEGCNNKDLHSKSIIYVISEKKDIVKFKFINDAITINFTADAEIIKS